ncbi:MAG: class I SAM-dependent methyltransferase [Bacteroidales bacterium]|nr:class I SAM-dependent methyltransferase [Bacteroidales bacterium]
MLNSSKLDSYGKFKIQQQKEHKNNVWTSFEIINKIKQYIKDNDLKFSNALDPCAGSGRLIEEFKEYNWTGYEIDKNVYNECINNNIKDKIKNSDFFDSECELDRFDLCICNPPYNKSNLNNWLKHILFNLSGYLFLIVPYNFINKIKEQYKNLIVDYIGDRSIMDRNFHNKVIVYIFKTDNNEPKINELFDSLFYIDIPEKLKVGKPIYLRKFLQNIDIEFPKFKKINEIPDGTLHPVYTFASGPVKYTDSDTACPEDVIIFCNTFINSSCSLKYSKEAPYFNQRQSIFKFKNEKCKNFIIDNLLIIVKYLHELFKYNMLTTLLNPLDILNIPIYKYSENVESMLNTEFEKFIKRFKYFDLIENFKVDWKQEK